MKKITLMAGLLLMAGGAMAGGKMESAPKSENTLVRDYYCGEIVYKKVSNDDGTVSVVQGVGGGTGATQEEACANALKNAQAELDAKLEPAS